jgi:acylphosphatase
MVNDQKALSISLYGRVQGVGCRRFLLERAAELSIKGHVKNNADGTVFIFAMGTNMQLDEFLEWCHKGSPVAKVKKVTVNVAELSEEINFKIVRN